ncbi:MAG TPA: hypothetical protein VJQ54_00220 [Candidatus Sulfotelmatobacter sp.]|nr:hypothetical protein [Candidatus Sulfotelmatobacter sp.]
MSGRSVALLASFFLLVSPIVPAGQEPPVNGVHPGSARALESDLPALRVPVRGPSMPVRPFPISAVDANKVSGLARAAGTIFSGTVIRIEHQAPFKGQTIGTVKVTFLVENAFRGATRGRQSTFSEWIGLWQSGQRYRLGERVFVFLYPRSRVGLTSCVSGSMGRFEMDSQGSVLLSAQQVSVFRKDPVLGGRSRVPFSDFASAVRQASEEE